MNCVDVVFIFSSSFYRLAKWDKKKETEKKGNQQNAMLFLSFFLILVFYMTWHEKWWHCINTHAKKNDALHRIWTMFCYLYFIDIQFMYMAFKFCPLKLWMIANLFMFLCCSCCCCCFSISFSVNFFSFSLFYFLYAKCVLYSGRVCIV